MNLIARLLRRRSAAYLLDALVVVASIVIIVSSCSGKVMSEQEASHWIAAYAPVHIDKDSKIRLELTDASRARLDTTRALAKAFRFSPGVKGRAVVSRDKRFIDFIPAESLKEGRRYECRVDMKALTAVDTLADFAFDFYVDQRQVRFEDVSVTVDPDNIAMMIVKGRLAYNIAAGDSITGDSAILQCSYPGARIVMGERVDSHSRRFTVRGVKRQTVDKPLRLSINPASGYAAAEHEMVVPSVADFRLLSSRRVEAAEPYIDLEFTTPLSSQQELDGLISIDGVADLKIERLGTNVKIYYPRNGITDLTLRISDVLKNNDGRSLDREVVCHFAQEVIPPAIEIPFDGTILPDNRNLKLPFRAVNLAAVDVEVVKIFPSNVMSFLHINDIDETSQLRRFGRLIYRQTVRLDGDKSLNLHQWQNFSVDLSNLFAAERGAVYNIFLTFRKAYSLYNRTEPEPFEVAGGLTADDKSRWDRNNPYIYRDAPDYSSSRWNWNEADDPTKDTYYMKTYDRMPEINVVASNLGVIAKRGADNVTKVVVNDIMTAQPAAGIRIEGFNYQSQKIGSAITDERGFADLRTDGSPFLITASDGVSTTYLKVGAYNELETSNFDVAGTTVTDGIKGFTYGDRGVWRPGDEVHLTLIVEDKARALPANHPVVMKLYNPNEQLYDRQVLEHGTDGFYVFNIATDESAPTGLWTAVFEVGNQTFIHPVRIETIKPNRLKININAPEVIQANSPTPIELNVHRLTGPVAKNMKASVGMTLYADPNPFKKYKKFTFRNPLVNYSSSEKDLFSATTDSLGNVSRSCTVGADINSPGMLLANITARVTEPGGDASIVSKSVSFSPFGVYVGIDLTTTDFETDTHIKMPVVVLNQMGAKMKTRQLDYKIYRLDWNWWWEGGGADLDSYVKSTTADVVASGSITATNGVAELPFKVEYPDWGRYLVLLRDAKGGHATGGIITVDWPQWRGRSNKGSASGSTELSFTLDKARYEVGETANVFLPQCKGGRALLSIENGSRVLKEIWVNLSADKETKYPLYVDRTMAPNFYVTATLLRPHKETDFDTPIRLFGIQSATVVNQQSILHPVIDMPDELRPQQPFTVRISEKDRKPMTYTLAIVDEGLLDITNFKTPRPWYAMNQKEALGVRTWDMYDDVIGAFGSNFRSILRVGGDEAMRKAAGKEKRFNPAVKFLGPFTIKGGSNTHRITLPNYVGSVRVMVVAGGSGCYGNADKTVKVVSPLMLLTSLPATLANCDTVTMPVNVFAMEAGIKNVAIDIDVDGPVKVGGPTKKNVAFAEPGEELTTFRLICDRSKEDKARIIVTASADGHVIKDTTFIDVTNPMPTICHSVEKSLARGGRADFEWSAAEVDKVSLQVASMPMLNFSGVALFMEQYPHLCTEQLTSKALFMLYGRKFLDADERANCDKALPRLIKSVQARQAANGGFVYWSGAQEPDEWVTSMAGLALTEAARQGFRVDKSCLDKWLSYQQTHARDYRYSLATDLTQAYRLYSLATAGSPQTAAMNRLRESKQLSQGGAYALAAAYAQAGRTDVGTKLIERANRTEASEGSDMFWSAPRNDAIALDAYTLCGMTPEALTVACKIAGECSAACYVTQDIAFATVAMSRLSDLMGTGTPSIRLTQPGKTPLDIAGFKSVKDIVLDARAGKVAVENLNGSDALELSLLTSYRPTPDRTVAAQANGLKMSVAFTDMQGRPIDVRSLKQDTEFKAEITIANTGEDVDNLAVTFGVPSGWEIWNTRMHGAPDGSYDNCDIRDNACKYYFPIQKGHAKKVKIRLRAAYPGHYMLPPAVCEDMYNPACRASTANSRVMVEI